MPLLILSHSQGDFSFIPFFSVGISHVSQGGLKLLNSSKATASSSPVSETIGTCHHGWPFLFLLNPNYIRWDGFSPILTQGSWGAASEGASCKHCFSFHRLVVEEPTHKLATLVWLKTTVAL